MKIDRHYLLLGAFLIALEGLVAGVAMGRPPWGDEEHFVETVRLFGQEPTLETLRTYPEMNAPLPFVLYAAWGRVFGYELPALRVLSLIVALLTYGSFCAWAHARWRSPRTAAWLTAFLALQPYMAGFSIFVFTDMLAILFLIWGCWGVSLRNGGLLFVGVAGALLCRQYMVFLALAIGATFALRWLYDRNWRDALRVAVVGLATLPLIGLLVLWQGTCPDNRLRGIYLTEPFRFHPEALTLYLAQLPVYLLPLVVLSWRSVYGWRGLLVSAVVGCAWYGLFPIHVSQASLDAGLDTVGYFDKLLHWLGGSTASHAGFCIALCGALPIVWGVGYDSIERLRNRQLDATLFAAWVVAAFLLVMPVSYLAWEKYFVPLLPVLAMEWFAWFPRRTSVIEPTS